MTQKTKDIISKHLPLFISVVTTTAVAVFWAVNYVNTPINSIDKHLASIDEQLKNVEQAHEAYGKLAADEAQAIININLRDEKICTQFKIDCSIH